MANTVTRADFSESFLTFDSAFKVASNSRIHAAYSIASGEVKTVDGFFTKIIKAISKLASSLTGGTSEIITAPIKAGISTIEEDIKKEDAKKLIEFFPKGNERGKFIKEVSFEISQKLQDSGFFEGKSKSEIKQLGNDIAKFTISEISNSKLGEIDIQYDREICHKKIVELALERLQAQESVRFSSLSPKDVQHIESNTQLMTDGLMVDNSYNKSKSGGR